MKILTYLLFMIIVIALTISQTMAQSGKRTPVIVELFTSEGCSTCPPADKYLEVLAEQQPIADVDVIALSEHVDYWNRFGWTDPFSATQFTTRQTYYAAFFKQAEVYTPQMVVDGTREFVGSRIQDGVKQISEAANNPKSDINLEIVKAAKNTFSLKVKTDRLPKLSDDDKAVVFLAVTENELSSSVTRGENSGKTLKHIAVTRYLKEIGVVKNTQSNFTAEIKVDKNWKRENLNAITFVQETESRRILGAAKISLKN